MKASKRHNFNKQVVLLLKNRAGDVCSNPECRVHTLGSSSLKEKTASIGVAAHIYAASPGGARYDFGMSEEKRKSYENGIWLCQTCSRLIDADESRFPAKLLFSWKSEAESRSLTSVGKKSITQQEKEKAVRIAYGQGILDQSSGDVAIGSVSNVIEGYEHNLSRLDERFDVIVERATSSSVIHRIEPRNGYNPTIELSVSNVGGSWDGLQRLENLGESVEITGSAINFKGSKLFERLGGSLVKGGSLTIAGISRKLETYVLLRSETAGDYELASFDSDMRSGSKGFSISGSSLGGIISVRVISELNKGTNLDINYTIEPWIGRRLDKLSYFPKLLKARDFLRRNDDARLVVEFYHKTNPIVFDATDSAKQADFLGQIFHTLTMLELCRAIATRIPTSLVFKEFTLEEDEYNTVKRYYSIIGGSNRQVPAGNVICEGVLLEGVETSLDEWEAAGKGWIRYRENPEVRQIKILGNVVVPPSIFRLFHKFEMALFCKLNAKGTNEISYILSTVEGSTFAFILDEEQDWVVLPD